MNIVKRVGMLSAGITARDMTIPRKRRGAGILAHSRAYVLHHVPPE